MQGPKTGTELFGTLLRRYRLAAGMSQEALASQAGLSAAAIAALERGRRTTPRAFTLALLAEALSLDEASRAALVAAATSGTLPEAAESAPQPIRTAEPETPRRFEPIGASPLIGRERDDAAVQRLLAQPNGTGKAQLLTLTGPGGVGKTSLALAVAASLRESYADGAVLVDLSTLRDSDLVLDAIARAVGVREAGGRDIGALLQEHLRSRQMLIVLDNFEQVVDAAPRVAELVTACPQLTLLVTSRVALRVRAEQQYRVLPLSIPTAFRHASTEALSSLAAVRLFVLRAQAIRPDFQLTPESARTVAQICYRLDGLPLAIELAAARISLLPPVALLDRLERRLTLLTKGARDLPARQQTLRATIEWSYDLIAPEEQRLFRRLGIFAGSCSTAAAEAVCSMGGASTGILERLATLVDHSLLRQETAANGDAEPRVAMLETLREYASEQLEASGEAGALRHAHALYYVALAEAAEPELYRAEKTLWIERLARDHENLRQVLDWALEPTDAATAGERRGIGLRLAAALWRFWLIQGYLSEGHQRLEQLLATGIEPAACPPIVRAHALSGAGWLAHATDNFERASTWFQESIEIRRSLGLADEMTDLMVNEALEARAVGDYARATALLEECLAMHRATGDRRSVARGGLGLSLARLALVLCEQAEYERAEALYKECLALHQEIAEPGGIAVALLGLGDVERARGNAEQVRHYCRESLTLFQSAGERWGMGFALNNMALAALGEDDLEGAERLADEGLAVLRDTGSMSSVAEVLATRAVIAGARHDHGNAHVLFAEALQHARTAGPRWLVTTIFEGLAVLAQDEGRSHGAVRLFGAAASLRLALGTPSPPAGRERHERARQAAAVALGQEVAAEQWTAGASASLDAMIQEALQT